MQRQTSSAVLFARSRPTVPSRRARPPPFIFFFQMMRLPARSALFPYATLSRSLKLLAVRPVTAESKVTSQVNVSEFVGEVAGLERLIELSAGAVLSTT